MRNILIFICLISIFIGCSSSSFRDDGTNRNLIKNTKFKDDGTNLYDKSYTKKDKTKKKVEKKKTKKTVKKIKKEKKNKTVKKEKSNKVYEIKTNSKDFFYPVSTVNISKPYKESGTNKNTGLDFKISKNTKIFSCSPGVVIFSGEKNGLGNTIFVYHNDGFISIYYNLNKLKVNKGDYIKNYDTIIAYADDSFHFELRKQNKKGIVTLDPQNKLKKRRK